MNGLTITRHIINGTLVLYLGGLTPGVNVIQWRPVNSPNRSTENIDNQHHRLSPDSAYVELSWISPQPLFEVRECFSNPTGADCEVNPDNTEHWHLETGPLECQDATKLGCRTDMWYIAP